ncbi:triple tyrosine motif-containing protein [Pedobacter sp. L105]|uniref:ligand-binding sensor domain-containing protein n=1 Tax=Pedobacter sp. L105 TaxID=1641871 RepID=UPI00131D7223|nr:triple tyrosine motif-containing protein [Pedobacter sp. L105]
MKRIIFMIIFCRVLLSTALAQATIGLPTIKNYKSSDYNAATEIWDIHQDSNGILYYANNDGLLTFNGSYWKHYSMPNKTPIKSLAIDTDGKIYVGGQDELGYFLPDENGILKFHSIKQLLPPVARQFADIWDIIIIDHQIFFRTVEAIFQYKNNKIKVFDANGGWVLMNKAGNQVYAQDRDSGLMVFKNGQWVSPFTKKEGSPLRVTGIMDYQKDTLLVTTLKNGLYLLHGNTLTKKTTLADHIFAYDLINCAKKIEDNRYAIGTALSGMLVIDKKGELIQRFSTAEGLQNAKVLSILSDRDQNLWLGLENGISFINYHTAIKHIHPVKEIQTVSSAIRIFNKRLYIGTSNGLYSVPIDLSKKDLSDNKGIFTEVANTRGEILNLTELNHQLLFGHHEGASLIKDNTAIPITTRQGVWSIKSFPAEPDLIAGTYTGLELIKNVNGKLKDDGKIKGIYESLGNLVTDKPDILWASNPYRGIYRMQISSDRKSIVNYQILTKKEGLPSVLNNQIYRIRNQVVFTTAHGVFEYDTKIKKFVPSAFFKPIFEQRSVQYLTEDAEHNIWFVSDDCVGVIDFRKKEAHRPYAVIYFSELNAQTTKGSDFIYPYNNQNIFISANDGMYHLNYSQYSQSRTPFRVLLSTVKTIDNKDSLIYGGYNPAHTHKTIHLAKRWNSFHFEYSSTLYGQESNVEFSYKLEGFDKEWSGWSLKTEKDYTNLPYGTYTFSIRGRNNLGHASSPVSYTFVVDPAWYQTIWANLAYVFISIYALTQILAWQKRRFILHQQKYEEEQVRLNYLHSLELDRNEKEIITLQKESLEAELQFKNKELATVTMHLVERGGILLNIKQALLTLMKNTSIPDPEHEFRSVFRLLDEIEKKNDDWNQFAIYFDQVHNNFLTILKNKYPGLSSTDLKLCAYLRLNLSSKEIAQLMNISLKGVEISRYRIRKKMELTTEVNLYDFLIRITQTPS